MELSVGMRVKVVAPDARTGDDMFVGRFGVVTNVGEALFSGYTHEVRLDGDDAADNPTYFMASELALVETTVIEGAVEPHPWQSKYGVLHADGDSDAEYVVPSDYVGKRVRVTIEEIDA